MRFIHLADVHLDTLFASRDDRLREALRDASRQALANAVDLAVARDVDAVLVAGDLFDGERLSFQTERLLIGAAKRLADAGIQLIYATGNHDHSGAGHRGHGLEWPESVMLVKGAEPQRIEVLREGAVVGHVTAAGHETAAEERDLAASFPPRARSGLPEVALLHAQVVGARDAERHDRYAATELRTLQLAGYDYWALGHVHRSQRLGDRGEIWYSGNTQGTNPRDTGPKGCLLVDLSSSGTPDVRFHPLAPIRWEILSLSDIGGAGTLSALVARVEREWSESRRSDPDPAREWILRLDLTGSTPLSRELSSDAELVQLGFEIERVLGVLAVDVRADVHPPADPATHRGRHDVLGEALRLIEEARASAAVRAALAPDELARSGPADETELDAYLVELLDGLDAELAARMLAGRERDR